MGMGMDEEWDDECGILLQMDDPVWVMKTGEEVLIENMDDQHLKNTVKMLARKGGVHPQFSILCEELSRRKWKK